MKDSPSRPPLLMASETSGLPPVGRNQHTRTASISSLSSGWKQRFLPSNTDSRKRDVFADSRPPSGASLGRKMSMKILKQEIRVWDETKAVMRLWFEESIRFQYFNFFLIQVEQACRNMPNVYSIVGLKSEEALEKAIRKGVSAFEKSTQYTLDDYCGVVKIFIRIFAAPSNLMVHNDFPASFLCLMTEADLMDTGQFIEQIETLLSENNSPADYFGRLVLHFQTCVIVFESLKNIVLIGLQGYNLLWGIRGGYRTARWIFVYPNSPEPRRNRSKTI